MSKTAATRHYDLYIREDGKRFFFRYEDRGVDVTDNGIAWTSGEVERREKYTDIDTVRLQSGTTGQSTLYSCLIRFNDGRELRVTSASEYGMGDDGQAKIYGQFVRDFHSRIPQSDRDRIQFTTGNSESRQNFLWTAIVIAVLFFIGLPLVLFLITNDIQAIWILIAGGTFLYPVIRTAMANQPQKYRCEYLPEDLVPV